MHTGCSRGTWWQKTPDMGTRTWRIGVRYLASAHVEVLGELEVVLACRDNIHDLGDAGHRDQERACSGMELFAVNA